MLLELIFVCCLIDNYVWLVYGNGQIVLIDVFEVVLIFVELQVCGWGFDLIVLIYYYVDYIQVVFEVVVVIGVKVLGNVDDVYCLLVLDIVICFGQQIQICNEFVDVIDVLGYVIGYVVFYLLDLDFVFIVDSLMVLGCGCLFEGDVVMMWDSLLWLNVLFGQMLICLGYDYCYGNGVFVFLIDFVNEVLQ